MKESIVKCSVCNDKGRSEIVEGWFDYCGCRKGKVVKCDDLIHEQRQLERQLDTVKSTIKNIKSYLAL